MRGHAPLIEMRLQGAAPDVVWLDTNRELDPCCGDWHTTFPSRLKSPHLQLDPTESPARADLRCVVGLTVSISGHDLNRVRATRDACIAAGAKRVIAATTKQRGEGDFVTFDVVELTDTDGHLGEVVSPEEYVHG